MSNLFYNRYIPPSTTSQDVAGTTTLSERPRKRTKTAKAAAHDEPTSEDLRHQKLRLKYEKSRTPADQRPIENIAEPNDSKDATKPRTDVQDSERHGLVPIPQPAPAPDAPKVSIASALPDWIRHPSYVSSGLITAWKELPLPSTTVEILTAKGYRHALPIQDALLRYLLPDSPSRYNGDVCVSAATGSGKTLAYALPMVEVLRGMPARKLRGLVVVPTRELVAQAKETLDLCARGSGLKIGTAVGTKELKEERDLLVAKGEKYDVQAYLEEKSKSVDELEELMDWDFEALKELVVELPLLPGWVVDYTSKLDILICTPGRLVEHVKSTTGFNLHSVQWMVIDEADRLLDESFQQWVSTITPQLQYLPELEPLEQKLHRTFRISRNREVKKILLSATMTRDVSKLTALKLSNPKLVDLESGSHEHTADSQDKSMGGRMYTIPPSLVEFAVAVVDANDKPLYLLEILEHGVQRPGPSHNNLKKQESSLDNGGNGYSPESSSSDAEHMTSSSISSVSSTTNDVSDFNRNPGIDPLRSHRSVPLSTRGTLIFTSSTSTSSRLSHLISSLRPHIATHVHTFTKYTSKQDRKKAFSSFAKPNNHGSALPDFLPIIIATDLLSHGIDIPSLYQVVNYSVPSSVNDYIHRVGRTARADLPGRAITLLESQQARWFWNEIARSPSIARNDNVIRGTVILSSWDEDAREAYASALEKLGEAATGSTS